MPFQPFLQSFHANNVHERFGLAATSDSYLKFTHTRLAFGPSYVWGGWVIQPLTSKGWTARSVGHILAPHHPEQHDHINVELIKARIRMDRPEIVTSDVETIAARIAETQKHCHQLYVCYTHQVRAITFTKTHPGVPVGTPTREGTIFAGAIIIPHEVPLPSDDDRPVWRELAAYLAPYIGAPVGCCAGTDARSVTSLAISHPSLDKYWSGETLFISGWHGHVNNPALLANSTELLDLLPEPPAVENQGLTGIYAAYQDASQAFSAARQALLAAVATSQPPSRTTAPVPIDQHALKVRTDDPYVNRILQALRTDPPTLSS